MKPIVGDIIWYWEGNVEYAAVVTRVHSAECVSLFVLDDTSGSFLGERATKRSISKGGARLTGCWTAKGEKP